VQPDGLISSRGISDSSDRMADTEERMGGEGRKGGEEREGRGGKMREEDKGGTGEFSC
jgi:hypothetical protein